MTTTLNELSLVRVLEQASSPNLHDRTAQSEAEQQLKQWESQPGYHYLLQSIYLDLSNSLQIRWLAIIQFKNGVEKYWRSTRINCILKDEKNSIRLRLFEGIDEQNNQLCIQNSQATARIARLDFPVDWPNIFEQLEQLLSSDRVRVDPVIIYNVLMHTNQVIKSLGSARIGRCRPAMQSKVPLIFPLVVRVYLESFEEWTSNSQMDSDALSKIQVCYMALKVIRRLISDGYEQPHKVSAVEDFMQLSITHFEMLINNHSNYSKMDLYEKFVKCYGKLYYQLVKTLPSSFIAFPCSNYILLSYTKLLLNIAPTVYNENPEESGGFWEQTAIRGFLVLKNVMNFLYKKGAMSLKMKSDKALIDGAMDRIRTEIFNDKTIKQLLDALIDWYMKLRSSELESWFLDPEEWINEQMATSYEYQIRPCAENIFQDLINIFPEISVPYFMNKIQYEASNLPDTMDGFLQKDSIYSSFQLSAQIIYGIVDFDKLLTETFLPEATNPNTAEDYLRVIRRRLALIINEWALIKCSDSSKKLCYNYILEILRSEDDKVVLLSTTQCLRNMIDDWNFSKELFEPFLTDTVRVLLRKVLPQVSFTETRLYILNTLTDIIIQTKPLASHDLLMEIFQVVPELWQIALKSSTDHILCNGLLRMIKNVASSMGSKSNLTWDLSWEMVAVSCNPNSQQYQLLNEDGYELWSTLLQHFSADEAELDNRFMEILPFLEYGIELHSEVLPVLLDIVKSYALILGQERFFDYSTFANIFKLMANNLLKLREDSCQTILEIWEILVLGAGSNQGTVLLKSFYDCGILKALFNSVFLEESLSTFQCGQMIQILARISYINPGSLLEFLSSYHQELPQMEENMKLPLNERKLVFREMAFDALIKKFLAVWIVCFKDMFDPKIKKIHILGISSLLRTCSVPILTEFEVISSLWIEMLEEINETNNGDCEKYHLNDIITETSYEYYEITNENIRYNKLLQCNDPVHNVSLKVFISQIMEILKDTLGDERFRELIASVDPKILEELQLFMSIRPQQ